ncbi:MAG: dihydroneopterin aldolase [Gemmatimonadaceae bacterium]|nr:dihydroneopterin aldolase [Gemmatimonadaceae bacterium]
MPAPVEITLRNMRFHCRVGILPHEAEFSQPLEVDLTVWATPAPLGAITVDYRALYDLTARCVAAGPLRYLETLGQEIAAGAVALPGVRGARVALRKPQVALGGPLDHAEVVVEDGARA